MTDLYPWLAMAPLVLILVVTLTMFEFVIVILSRLIGVAISFAILWSFCWGLSEVNYEQ